MNRKKPTKLEKLIEEILEAALADRRFILWEDDNGVTWIEYAPDEE